MTNLSDGNPIYWFRPVSALNDLIHEEPDAIEWLKIETGECFIHTFGTAFWRDSTKFYISDILHSGITHWRIKEKGYSEKIHKEESKEYMGRASWLRVL